MIQGKVYIFIQTIYDNRTGVLQVFRSFIIEVRVFCYLSSRDFNYLWVSIFIIALLSIFHSNVAVCYADSALPFKLSYIASIAMIFMIISLLHYWLVLSISIPNSSRMKTLNDVGVWINFRSKYYWIIIIVIFLLFLQKMLIWTKNELIILRIYDYSC